ncbi:ribulose-phosphate 3-epimerase [Candidatus Magnetaquicoccus inordinatus]|uniref:ribulose-phosphate 3-epimerase n=1 Tax=Candidatus Magnetaquicoccus inordinatus TaxID=2496818 RepID=UPI00102C87F8|nr:ribulose-phosphate 3-epimerase [Candidatus Magnetaquicoccus inordinatus]
MIKIAPSILSADFTRLGEEIRAVEEAGADYIHIDVMDGHFVPNLTIGPLVVEAIHRVARQPLDLHLMIEPVEPYLSEFAKAGADSITIHVEATRHLDRALQHIRELGCQVGVALNPATPLQTISELLPLLDRVVLMSVNPGFGGQSFIPYLLPKIRTLHQWIRDQGLTIALEVDGGIKVDNIAAAAAAGADTFVAGSAVFSQQDYATVIWQLRSSAENAYSG